MGYQNICGAILNSGLEIADEVDAMRELGTDTQGMSNINEPWSTGNTWRY